MTQPVGRRAAARAALAALAAATIGTRTAWAQDAGAGRLVELQIGAGDADAPPTFTARRGESVRLRVTSARPGALHLHGYRIELRVAGAEPSETTFVAGSAGRFALHFHAADAKAPSHRHGPPAAWLEVRPR